MTIWKFQLHGGAISEIRMPIGAEVLCVQAQGEIPTLWAKVNPENHMEWRKFRTWGTGHSMDESPGTYIGTFQLMDGSLVFHVFEELPL